MLMNIIDITPAIFMKKKKYCDCDNDTIIMLTNNSINNFHDDDNSINNEKKQTNELINKQ